MKNFEELMSLFSSSVENRGIVRLNLLEAAILYKYTKEANGDVVEIGRKYGGSAILMASALKNDDQKVYSIDITRHKHLKTHLNMFKDIIYKIVLLDGSSYEIGKKWDKKIGLVFVDGDHSFKGVKKDINIWCPFVEVGGFALFHDVRNTSIGLEPLIDKLKKENWKEIDCADSLVVLKKHNRKKDEF